jgi:hypothetical protein
MCVSDRATWDAVSVAVGGGGGGGGGGGRGTLWAFWGTESESGSEVVLGSGRGVGLCVTLLSI